MFRQRSNFCYARSGRCSLTLVSLLHVVIVFCVWTLDLSLVNAGRLGLLWRDPSGDWKCNAPASVFHSSALEASVIVRLHLPQFLRHQSWCDICCGLAKAYFFIAESGAKRRMQEHALHISDVYIYTYICIYQRKIFCYYLHTSMTKRCLSVLWYHIWNMFGQRSNDRYAR